MYLYVILTTDMGGFVSQEELRDIEVSLVNKKMFQKLYNYSKLSYIVFAVFILMFIYHFI